MKKLLTFILLSCSLALSAQNNAIQNAIKNYDYELAIKLISKERKTPEMDLLQAKCFKNISKYAEAIKILEELFKQNMDNSVVYELADCYQQSGNYAKAKTYYFMALQSAPAIRFARLNYVNILYKLKDFRHTIGECKAILKSDSLAVLYPILGDSYLQLPKMDSAIYYYKKAIDANSDDFNSLSKLAKLYQQTEKYDLLVSSTNEYIQRDSTNQLINQFNGIGYCMTGNFGKAISQLDKLNQYGDSSLLTNFYLGASYMALDDFYSAYKPLQTAYNTDSASSKICFYYGKVAVEYGDTKNGIRILERGLGIITPPDSMLYNYHYKLSEGYQQIHNGVEALKHLQLAAKYNPNSKMTLYKIASTYDTMLNNKTEALNYYRQFMLTQSKPKADNSKKNETPNLNRMSYYTIAEKRINELVQEMKTPKKD
jgi:tetratricopeptide (TPR) repeat protein